MPAATRIATVSLAGADWDVHLTQGRWPELWFVRTRPTTTVDLDLTPFLDLARQQVRVAYLSSIHAGVDVIDGTGRLDTTRFSVALP